jgi:hypothetical protein
MDRARTPDVLTIVSIAAVAAAITDVLHEGLGHGGACVLSGARPLVISTVHFECSVGSRILSAGGTIVNLIAGVICLFAARKVRAPRIRYFFWLLMVFNLLDAGGYWLYSGVGNIGDWAYVIHGWRPAWAWRIGLVVLGVISYWYFVVLSSNELRPLLSQDRGVSLQWARLFTFPAYFTNGVLLTVAGLFNPVGMMLVAISAMAASFGGTSGLLWMGKIATSESPKETIEGKSIERSFAWIAAAVVVAGIFIFVLGPGIRIVLYKG